MSKREELPDGLPRGSASHRLTWTGSTSSDLGGVPAFNLWTQPEHRTTAAEVEDGTRHVRVARLVLADRVPVREPKNLGDVVGVHEIVEGDSSRHE